MTAAGCSGDDGGSGSGGTSGTSATGGSTTAGSSTGSPTTGSTSSDTGTSTSTTAGSSTTAGDTTGTTTGGGDVDPFRVTELYVRDPHFFADVSLLGCNDVTDLEILGMKGVNPSFNEAMTTDVDDDAGSGNPDGNLDLSFMLLFQPLDQAGSGPFDFQRADCKVPASMTVCSPRDGATVSSFNYTSMMDATCLEADPAHLTNMYSPKPNTVTGDCFSSTGDVLVLQLGDIELPLTDAQVAATYDADPADNFMTGLIVGFLSEADAAVATLPQSIQDSTGATFVADLLPGSASNCAGHDDRDDNNGTSGWWMYVDFKAERVPWTP